jgi:hypothetical protein
MAAVTKATIRSGLTYVELRRRVSESQASQVPPYDGTATLVTLGSARGRILSSSGIERSLRRLELPEDEPVFVAVPDVTTEALEYLDSRNVRLLRESTYRVVVRTDDDIATN